MKKIFVLIAGLAMISCGNEQKVDYTLISGKIDNKKDDKIIVYENGFQKEIELKKDGSFSDTLRVAAGYFKLVHGNGSTNLFLTPAKELQLMTDANQFLDSLRYSGKASLENEYLLAKMRKNAKRDASAIFSQKEADFIKQVKEIRAEADSNLDKATDLDKEFVAIERKNIEYSHLINIARYPNFYVTYFKHPDYVASEKLTALLKDVDYDNEEDFNTYKTYRDLVFLHYRESTNPQKNVKTAIATLKGIKSKSIQMEFVEELAFYISPSFKEVDFLYKSLTELAPDENFKKELAEKYATIQKLVAGKESPTFDYENHKGGTTSLTDLQGKYVYIDVWATWCGPCIAEIPALKKVEEDYHDKNITFVSISVDELKDHDKWKQMVSSKELGGVQLMADNAWKSSFVTDYAIDGIPRFILIDPNGKIVNADAPRPSDEKLIKLFDKLKI